MTSNCRLIVIAPASLSDDFEIRPDAAEVLQRVNLSVVSAPDELTDDLRANATILITGLERQRQSPVALARELPNLRWIHSFTAGVEQLAVPDLVERNVLVTNGAGAYAPAIAEYVVAGIVMLLRGLPRLMLANETRCWLSHDLGRELGSLRVGVVGLGGIGGQVAEICAAAGASVWGLRRSVGLPIPPSVDRVLTPDRLQELLRACDCVVISTSLNQESRNLLGRDEFKAMRRGSYLINVSRGAVVDESALLEALRTGTVAGAVLDVTSTEPLDSSSPLWGAPNLWITPHMSGGTIESRKRALDVFIRNLARYLAGDLELLENVVDLSRELP